MLHGKKVTLRPVRQQDNPLFLRWVNDTKITRNTQSFRPVTELEVREWFTNLVANKSSVVFSIVRNHQNGRPGRLIGNIGLFGIHPANHNAQFGIMIGDRASHGQGCGTEAGRLIIAYGFNSLNLHRIDSRVYSFNTPSLRLHARLGFAQEGCSREAVFKEGHYSDVFHFGLLRHDWQQ